DVNNSGTKLEPKVTPADAQMIFNKYIKKGDLTGDCSGSLRTASFEFKPASPTLSAGHLISAQPLADPSGYVYFPVFVEFSADITSFGIDFSFPSGTLTFVGLEKTELTEEYSQLGGNVLNDFSARIDPGVEGAERSILRVGGFKLTSSGKRVSGVLVTLVFRADREMTEPQPLRIIALYDEIEGIEILDSPLGRRSFRTDDEYVKDREARSKGKRYDL
ncbi:MAG: hypothetical protein WAU81_01020, partial [Candidatus Aminicenantales bacterium]